MIIKTRKLAATSTEGERMRATADTGATLTLPMSYGALDPHANVAQALAVALFGVGYVAVRTDGQTFRVDPVTRER